MTFCYRQCTSGGPEGETSEGARLSPLSRVQVARSNVRGVRARDLRAGYGRRSVRPTCTELTFGSSSSCARLAALVTAVNN